MFALYHRSLWACRNMTTLLAANDCGHMATCSLRASACLKHEFSGDEGTCSKTSSSNPLKAKTPIGKLDELEQGKHPYQEKEPLAEFPDGVNPSTGEVGGPRGPEPTRYGDWERKGRVTDF